MINRLICLCRGHKWKLEFYHKRVLPDFHWEAFEYYKCTRCGKNKEEMGMSKKITISLTKSEFNTIKGVLLGKWGGYCLREIQESNPNCGELIRPLEKWEYKEYEKIGKIIKYFNEVEYCK